MFVGNRKLSVKSLLEKQLLIHYHTNYFEIWSSIEVLDNYLGSQWVSNGNWFCRDPNTELLLSVVRYSWTFPILLLDRVYMFSLAIYNSCWYRFLADSTSRRQKSKYDNWKKIWKRIILGVPGLIALRVVMAVMSKWYWKCKRIWKWEKICSWNQVQLQQYWNMKEILKKGEYVVLIGAAGDNTNDGHKSVKSSDTKVHVVIWTRNATVHCSKSVNMAQMVRESHVITKPMVFALVEWQKIVIVNSRCR